MRLRDPLILSRVLQGARASQSIRAPQRSTYRKFYRTSTREPPPRAPNFAFAFDIDGVLVRSSKPVPGASQSLSYLQSQRIPFILLTNGGGKHESERAEELSQKLQVPLDTSMVVQSHTPFAELASKHEGGFRDKNILVVGGDGGKCREVAEKYGFKSVITPGDILAQYPSIWPFSRNFLYYYRSFAKPLPRPIDQHNPSKSLKIDAIFVFNDPRDWALDTQVILDILLSSQGILGTTSPKNNNRNLPNRGYQQDNQPPLYFSNPDLWWAAGYHLPRLGQGGFREAFEGVWAAVTGGPREGVQLQKTVIGKPFRDTYEFAEKRLITTRERLFSAAEMEPLKRVYMIGDNPESDIRGANVYQSPFGTDWTSVLVRSGVYDGGEPAWRPRTIVDDVWKAVNWGIEQSQWSPRPSKD